MISTSMVAEVTYYHDQCCCMPVFPSPVVDEPGLPNDAVPNRIEPMAGFEAVAILAVKSMLCFIG